VRDDLTPERWERISAAFEQALQLDEGERAAFLEALVADDGDLAAEVAELLEAHEGRGLLDRFAERVGSWLRDDAPPATERVGPFKLLREIGRGGMGTVYLAVRDDPQVPQRVALKLAQSGLDTEEIRGRFIKERRILAALSHPGIAALVDAGISDDGRPYFAMEYVDGTPIDRDCDKRRLDVRKRLLLFCEICDAVQYAHRNLIVHRDLKPANILVTADGRVKLLDFGIAKLLPEQGADEPSLTRTGLMPMTPGYASPEQFRGEAVTTVSDVYALGVVLYELLSGRRPYRVEGRSPSEVERVVCEQEPVRPSSAVSRAGNLDDGSGRSRLPTAEGVARARGTDRDRLKRKLAGDLDTIVLKALRKEPDRRYASADQLAADIRRHLDGLPVTARPVTVAYRVSKFVRRHRLGVAVTAALFGILVASAVIIARQARRTALQRDRAEQVTGFLIGLFESSDPYVTGGDTLSVREALERGAERIRVELAEQPEVKATVMYAIGDIYSSLGLPREALSFHEEALALRREVFEPDDRELAASLERVALHRAEAGDFAASVPVLEEAIAAQRRVGSDGSAELAAALTRLAYGWQLATEWERAEELYHEALAIYRRRDEPGDGIAATLGNLGWLQIAKGDLDSAEVFMREGLELRRRQLGADDPGLAFGLSSLAELLIRTGRLAAADSALLEALRILRAILEPDHPTVAALHVQRAQVAAQQGELERAEALLRDALGARAAAYGADHILVAETRNYLAGVMQRAGRYAEAEELWRAALDAYRAHYGSEHQFAAVVETNLAWIVHLQGRSAEADGLYAHAVPITKAVWPSTPGTASTMVDFGIVRTRSGNPAGAIPILREALAIARRARPADHDGLLRAQNALGSTLGLAGGYEEGEKLLLATISATEDRPDGDPYRAFAVSALARLREAWGKVEAAAR